MSELKRFESRLNVLRADGLSDIKISSGDVVGATVEDIAAEMNRMLDAIESGKFRPLSFDDSQPSAEPVAWMHEDPRRVDVIHESVRKLLNDSAGHLHRPLDKSERYTIPLYPHPPADEIEVLRRDAGLYRRLRGLTEQQLGQVGVPCVAVPEAYNRGRYVAGEALDAAIAQQEAGHDPAL